MRGEYRSRGLSGVWIEELPPRARRILTAVARAALKAGTTSACAENTHLRHNRVVLSGNYLRVRGEYSYSTLAASRNVELPPRARRILKNCIVNCITPGTTSACAENTRPRGYLRPLTGNYLRVRGEYLEEGFSPRTHEELPPRARRIPQAGGF